MPFSISTLKVSLHPTFYICFIKSSETFLTNVQVRINQWYNAKIFAIKIVKAYIKMYGGVGPEVQFGKRKDSDLVSHKLTLI